MRKGERLTRAAGQKEGEKVAKRQRKAESKEAKEARKKAKLPKQRKTPLWQRRRETRRLEWTNIEDNGCCGSWFAVGQGVRGPEAKAKTLVAADRQKAKTKEKRAAKRWKLDSVKNVSQLPKCRRRVLGRPLAGGQAGPKSIGEVGTPRITKKVSSKGVVHKVLGLGG